MEQILKVVLVVHVLCGFTSLLAGICALAARKGRLLHRMAGRVFFYSLLGVSATAVSISLVKSNDFLLMIGIFAFFQNYSGFRSVKNKSLKPSVADWVVLVIAAVNGIFMISTLNTVLVVFGLLSSSLAIREVRLFVSITQGKEINKKQWLLRHIGMMTGAFIATATAFVVVNVRSFHPAWVPWLLPTVVLVPIIIYWSRKVSKGAKVPARN